MGVSVEDQATADERIPYLMKTSAAVRFVSYEPALGPVDFMYPKTLWTDGPDGCCYGHECGCRGLPVDPPLIYGIDWVIIGGESGPGARPFHAKWAESVISQCKETGVAVFMKQTGKRLYYDDGAGWLNMEHPKGGDMSEWPEGLRVREWPNG